MLPLDETVLPRVLCDSDDLPLAKEETALSAPLDSPLGMGEVAFGHAPGRESTAGVGSCCCCCCVVVVDDKDLADEEFWRSRGSGMNTGMSTCFNM